MCDIIVHGKIPGYEVGIGLAGEESLNDIVDPLELADKNERFC